MCVLSLSPETLVSESSKFPSFAREKLEIAQFHISKFQISHFKSFLPWEEPPRTHLIFFSKHSLYQLFSNFVFGYVIE